MSKPHIKRAVLSQLTALPLATPPVLAQRADADATAQLIALDEAWIDAEVRHDQTALERILDDRFLATLPSGATLDRAAFIDRIMKTSIKPLGRPRGDSHSWRRGTDHRYQPGSEDQVHLDRDET